MQKQNSYKGYSLFNNVEDPALRTWNRCTVMLNINKDHGSGFVEGYAQCMGKVERMQMMAMYQYIAVKGAEAVRLEINQGRHSPQNEGGSGADKVLH
jgi:hypothetical protein